METPSHPDSISGESKPSPFASLLVFGGFCGVTYLGNVHPAWLSVAVLGMYGLPLLWAWRTRSWKSMGFAASEPASTLLWGVGGGGLSALVGLLAIGEITLPPDLPQQLVVAIPLWLLIASPFQELFFRGWLQSRLQAALGTWPGFLTALGCFTLWHFTLPIFGPQSSFPMITLRGILGTAAAGLIYGYLLLRTRNIIAPILAHAIAGIFFVIAGAATFLPAP